MSGAVGVVMIAAVFIGLFAMTAWQDGIWDALMAWSFAVALTAFMVAGVCLATGEWSL